MTSERLAEIRERADAATPGPWGHWNPTGTQNHAVCTDEGDIATDNEGVWYSEADAEFIAHARTDVPDLTEQIDHLTADNARLREGVARIEALHGAVQEFEPCPTEWKGCDDPACTESVHDGGLYHSDQPTGRVCLTCRYEDGEPHDWPCGTAALLNPPTEGETDHE